MHSDSNILSKLVSLIKVLFQIYHKLLLVYPLVNSLLDKRKHISLEKSAKHVLCLTATSAVKYIGNVFINLFYRYIITDCVLIYKYAIE